MSNTRSSSSAGKEYGIPDDCQDEDDMSGKPSAGPARPSGNSSRKLPPRVRMSKVMADVLNAPVPVKQSGASRNISSAEFMIRNELGKAMKGDGKSLDAILKLMDMSGRFDEASEEERAQVGVIEVPPRLPPDESELLFGPHREADRMKYLAMATRNSPEAVAYGELTAAFREQIRVGAERRRVDDYAGALSAFDEGVRIARGHLEENPVSHTWRSLLGGALARSGEIHWIQKDTTRAVIALRENLEIVRRLSQQAPSHRWHEFHVAQGLLLLAVSDDEPEKNLTEAAAILRRLSMSTALPVGLGPEVDRVQNIVTEELKKPRALVVTRPAVRRVNTGAVEIPAETRSS